MDWAALPGPINRKILIGFEYGWKLQAMIPIIKDVNS